MYKNIAAAYDESPEAGRALIAAISLAKCLGAGLHSVTVMASLPAYTAFAPGADADLQVSLEAGLMSSASSMHAKHAARNVLRNCIVCTPQAGHPVEAAMQSNHKQIDLLPFPRACPRLKWIRYLIGNCGMAKQILRD